MDRTEEEKIVQAGIEVTLGGKTYTVRPLVIRDSREWRRKVIKLISPIPEFVKTTSDTPEEFEQALTALLVTMPNEVVDLFFEYAKDLDRDKIESVATDAEISEAFKEVITVAFPLAQNVPEVITRLYSMEEGATKRKKSR